MTTEERVRCLEDRLAVFEAWLETIRANAKVRAMLRAFGIELPR